MILRIHPPVYIDGDWILGTQTCADGESTFCLQKRKTDAKLKMTYKKMEYVIQTFVCLLIADVLCLDMNIFSTFSFNEDAQRFGIESSITDFISLANDPKSSLPDSFTICGSIPLKFEWHASHFVQMYTEDGSHWFSFLISIREGLNLVNRLTVNKHPSTGAYQQETFNIVPVPIVPHSWYHVCLGLDTVSGHLRIVINGVAVVYMEKQYFKNSTARKPRSLIGKVAGEIIT